MINVSPSRQEAYETIARAARLIESAINDCRRKLVDRAAFMETMGLKQ